MDYTKEQIARIKSNCPPVDESDYEEWLDGIDGDINVCGMKFQASRILRELDPIAFNCGFNDYLDADESITEVDGEYYHQSDIDEVLEEED